jgi:acyl-coenzyme A thioesterase PaaI-like protein
MNDLKNHPIIRQYIEWNQFGSLLGMSFDIPEKGKAVYRMRIRQLHLATPFAAHGGSVAALMDAALGVACLSQVCEEGRAHRRSRSHEGR